MNINNQSPSEALSAQTKLKDVESVQTLQHFSGHNVDITLINKPVTDF